MMSELTDPGLLRPTLGREGLCQRLLTELILDGPYPPYNTRRTPSPRGAQFLGLLDHLSFGMDGIAGCEPLFVDEIDLPARNPDEKGCAPDYTVFLPDRCWIIELKTEPGSHRPTQVPEYFERAHHYHPDLRVDITYLTAGLRKPFDPPTEDWGRYAHVEWRQVTDLIRAAWSDAASELEHKVVTMLLTAIEHLNEPAPAWWSRLGYEVQPVAPSAAMARAAVPTLATAEPSSGAESGVLDQAIALARATGGDGHQRAIGFERGGLEALDELRLELRRVCRNSAEDSPLRRVQPWLWKSASSGGKAMTPAGGLTGFEIRLSRSKAGA